MSERTGDGRDRTTTGTVMPKHTGYGDVESFISARLRGLSLKKTPDFQTTVGNTLELCRNDINDAYDDIIGVVERERNAVLDNISRYKDYYEQNLLRHILFDETLSPTPRVMVYRKSKAAIKTACSSLTYFVFGKSILDLDDNVLEIILDYVNTSDSTKVYTECETCTYARNGDQRGTNRTTDTYRKTKTHVRDAIPKKLWAVYMTCNKFRTLLTTTYLSSEKTK